MIEPGFSFPALGSLRSLVGDGISGRGGFSSSSTSTPRVSVSLFGSTSFWASADPGATLECSAVAVPTISGVFALRTVRIGKTRSAALGRRDQVTSVAFVSKFSDPDMLIHVDTRGRAYLHRGQSAREGIEVGGKRSVHSRVGVKVGRDRETACDRKLALQVLVRQRAGLEQPRALEAV